MFKGNSLGSGRKHIENYSFFLCLLGNLAELLAWVPSLWDVVLISNDDLAQIVETSDEWISVRTGIRNRRVLTGTMLFAMPSLPL